MTRRNALWMKQLFAAAMILVAAFLAVSAQADEGDDSELDSLGGAIRQADTPEAIEQAWGEALKLESSGRYYAAAGTFFNIYTAGQNHRTHALGKVAESLIRAHLYNAAVYFYIKTLQSGDQAAVRGVLHYLPSMLDRVGGDVLRKYIVRHTRPEDYDESTRNHFYYFVAKDELLKGDPQAALNALSKVSGSGVLAQAMFVKGTALSITGQLPAAVSAFESCRRISAGSSSREAEDLNARCIAGIARVFYQMNQFERAEELYDEIPKSSFVWTDILFEHAWTAYAKGDFNRTLGKLVTYHSPSLEFVFNPEVEVLRAQTYMTLCLYDDVNKVVNEFNSRYSEVGGKMKSFIMSNERDLRAFHDLGRRTFTAKLHTNDMLARAVNRFVRGPYFASLIQQERAITKESGWIRKIAAAEVRARTFDEGFGGFLDKVLGWRKKSIELLGGAFVKNSLVDLYNETIADFDRISFIKLDMLGKSKARLDKKFATSEDEDGVVKKGKGKISTKDYQYFWNFNGEFWIDELGDYVFALESECGA